MIQCLCCLHTSPHSFSRMTSFDWAVQDSRTASHDWVFMIMVRNTLSVSINTVYVSTEIITKITKKYARILLKLPFWLFLTYCTYSILLFDVNLTKKIGLINTTVGNEYINNDKGHVCTKNTYVHTGVVRCSRIHTSCPHVTSRKSMA